MKQHEALKRLDDLEAMHERGTIKRGHIEEMLKKQRRLHEANQAMLEALKNIIFQYGIVHGIGDMEMQSAIDFSNKAIAKGEQQ